MLSSSDQKKVVGLYRLRCCFKGNSWASTSIADDADAKEGAVACDNDDDDDDKEEVFGAASTTTTHSMSRDLFFLLSRTPALPDDKESPDCLRPEERSTSFSTIALGGFVVVVADVGNSVFNDDDEPTVDGRKHFRHATFEQHALRQA